MAEENVKKQKSLNWLSYVSYFVLCFTIVAKDYFAISMSINTLPYLDAFGELNVDPTVMTVMTFALHSILYALWVELFARFVYNSIARVSFSNVERYKFISIFKFIVAGVNMLLGLFNIMYFMYPFTFRLSAVIEVVVLTITFSIMYLIFYKKYLNKKSAPVIFLSMALPLAVYFIILAI